HLAVISIGEQIFVRSSLARWVESDEAAHVAIEPSTAEEALKSSLEGIRFIGAGIGDNGPTNKQLEPYRLVNSTEKLAAFCKLQPDQSSAPTVASVHPALCRPSLLPASARAKIRLAFNASGSTYCGTDPEIIACRADTVLTEF